MRRAEFEERVKMIEVANTTLLRHAEEGKRYISQPALTHAEYEDLRRLLARYEDEKTGRVSSRWVRRLIDCERVMAAAKTSKGESILSILADPIRRHTIEILNTRKQCSFWLERIGK